MRTSLRSWSLVGKIAVVALFGLAANQASAQLATQTTTYSPYHSSIELLVKNLLLAPGDSAYNIQYAGDTTAVGVFYGTSSVGIDSGVILMSGTILCDTNQGPCGPNNTGSSSSSLNMPGDWVLDSVSGGNTYDAAVLEYDYIPASDTIKFRFAFGSEEYPEFVGSALNDVFAVWISSDSLDIAPQNIALVPNTMDPIAINSVNNGASSTGPCMNCAYYFDNTTGGNPGIQFDGFTVPMEISFPLVPGVPYHIRVGIADAGDGIYDSGIFLLGPRPLPPVPPAPWWQTYTPLDTLALYDSLFFSGGSQSGQLSTGKALEANALQIPSVVRPDQSAWTWSSYPSECKVLITDAAGRTIFSSPRYRGEWQAASAPQGVYFYQVALADGRVQAGRVLVQR
jgi:hypothetical protein